MNTVTQQGVYATYLRQNLGYPLCSPSPSSEDDENGLGIGDVGYVDEYGQFVVVCNICCDPRDNPGSPQFQPIPLKEDLTKATPIPKKEIFTGVLQDISENRCLSTRTSRFKRSNSNFVSSQ